MSFSGCRSGLYCTFCRCPPKVLILLRIIVDDDDDDDDDDDRLVNVSSNLYSLYEIRCG